jgi:hypothetical protein
MPGEYLPFGIHDIWGYQSGSDAWQLQLMLVEAAEEVWFSRRDRRIGGPRASLFAIYSSVPCVRIDVQLFYKARAVRPKDEHDFRVCLPLLSSTERRWLADALRLESPDHPWIRLIEDPVST